MNLNQIKEKIETNEYDFLRTHPDLGSNIIFNMNEDNEIYKFKNLGIYAIFNTINTKMYIGSAKNLHNRYRKHLSNLKRNIHQNPHLQNAWNKYGENNFIFIILEILNDEKKVIEKEQYYIDKYKSYINVMGYNIRVKATSNIGIKLSDETKLKMSDSHKGENAYWFNKKMHPNFLKAADIAKRNKIYTDAEKEIISKRFKGRIKSKETIEKMKLAQSGSKNPSAKLNEEKVVEILKLLNDKISIKEIANMYNVSSETISCIKRGLTWKNVIRMENINE